MVLKGVHSEITLSSFPRFLSLFKELSTAVSLIENQSIFLSKEMLHSFMTFFAAASLIENTCMFTARLILADFILKTNFKTHAETCLLILFSSRGCVVLLPMAQSNFPGRYSNQPTKHLDDVRDRWLNRWRCIRFFHSSRHCWEYRSKISLT